MNLLKELQQTAKLNAIRISKEQDDILASVKDNLEIEHAEDLKMLEQFGVHYVIDSAKIKKGNQNFYVSGEWLREGDIKQICDKYALKFLPTEYYKNQVPITALNDMRNFEKNNGVKLVGVEAKDSSPNLYIIAPKSHFTLVRRPKKDPVLLYKTGGSYKIISTWGNDFNFIQRIKGFTNITGYTIRTFILLLFVAYMADIWIKQANGPTSVDIAPIFGGVFGAIGLAIAILVGIFEKWFGKPSHDEPYKS